MKFILKRKNKVSGGKGRRSLRRLFSIKQLYYFVYIAGIGAMVYIGYFIFENYYQTVTQAREIADLRKEVAPESIDLDKINKILEAIDNKSTSTNAIIDPNTNNPFDPFEGQQNSQAVVEPIDAEVKAE